MTRHTSIPEFPKKVQERLWEIQQWCGNRPTHLNSSEQEPLCYQEMGWRSSELKPAHGFRAPGRQDMVEELCIKRRALRNRYPRPQIPNSELVGQIMAYIPDLTEGSPYAHRDTYGFFDNNYVPPWDTWIAFVPIEDFSCDPVHTHSEPGILLSWVPECLSRFVFSNIFNNPDECIDWLGAYCHDDEILLQLRQMTTQRIFDGSDPTFQFIECHVRPI